MMMILKSSRYRVRATWLKVSSRPCYDQHPRSRFARLRDSDNNLQAYHVWKTDKSRAANKVTRFFLHDSVMEFLNTHAEVWAADKNGTSTARISRTPNRQSLLFMYYYFSVHSNVFFFFTMHASFSARTYRVTSLSMVNVASTVIKALQIR